METPIATAIDYLSAVKQSNGYKYFDDMSGQHWVSDEHDLTTLGQDLINYREADEAGEIDREACGIVSESLVYSTWCSNTDSVEA